MVRQSSPRKEHSKNQNEPRDAPIKAKRKDKNDKYRHQNNWLEDDEFDDYSDLDLYGEEEG
ncbi:MAG: hypothetical protein ACJAT4_002094 [Granulosicoccus sp.]|jgi:hypothetical protein